MNYAAKRVLTLASILALIVTSAAPAATAQQVTDTRFVVTATWLAEHSLDPTIAIVDTRPSEAYRQGHIPGALSLPWQKLAQPNTDESQIAPWSDQMMDQLGSVGISPGTLSSATMKAATCTPRACAGCSSTSATRTRPCSMAACQRGPS